MKVTRCFVETDLRTLAPTLAGVYDREHEYQRPAVLMWAEDYEALVKEVEEYRAVKGRTKTAWTERIKGEIE